MQEALDLAKTGHIREAESAFQDYINQNTHDPAAHKELGRLYLNTNQPQLALHSFEKAISLYEEDAQVFNMQGIAYKNLFLFSDAECSFQKAIELDPLYAAAHANYIGVLERLSNIDKANAALKQAKETLSDTKLLTLVEALLLKREKKFQEAIDLLENGNLPDDPATKLSVQSELIIFYDKLHDSEKTWKLLQDRNALAISTWSINEQSKSIYLDKIKACQETFTKDFVAHWPAGLDSFSNMSPVFLFSFPRSGTTLTQHVLDAHPDIHATEEIHAVPRIAEILEEQIGHYPTCLSALQTSTIKQLQDLYFNIHKEEKSWQDKKILVDKYPMNTTHAGLISRLFPHSKFIFAYRHPCDCILSSCMHLFTPNEGMMHTYSLEDTVHLYCAMMDLWFQYEAILPNPVLYTSYEELVTDFQPTLAKILDFVGVAWDDSLLDFQKHVQSKHVIRTPSYSQVSQNIYEDSKYRWERYRQYFEPYMDRLAPYIKKLGYE